MKKNKTDNKTSDTVKIQMKCGNQIVTYDALLTEMKCYHKFDPSCFDYSSVESKSDFDIVDEVNGYLHKWLLKGAKLLNMKYKDMVINEIHMYSLKSKNEVKMLIEVEDSKLWNK